MLGFDVPAGMDVAMPLGVLGGGDPAAFEVSLAVLVAADDRPWAASRTFAPDLSRLYFFTA